MATHLAGTGRPVIVLSRSTPRIVAKSSSTRISPDIVHQKILTVTAEVFCGQEICTAML